MDDLVAKNRKSDKTTSEVERKSLPVTVVKYPGMSCVPGRRRVSSIRAWKRWVVGSVRDEVC